MAKKKATKKKTAKARTTKPAAAAKPPTEAPEPSPSKPSTEQEFEWYDDGGNEGLKKRPIGGE